MQKWTRRIASLLLGVTMLLISVAPAYAMTNLTSKSRGLSFEDGTVKINAFVNDTGKTITISAELWRGTTRTGTWYDSGTSFAEITGVKTAHSGDTYTLKVSYTVNGTPYQFPDLVCVAP